MQWWIRLAMVNLNAQRDLAHSVCEEGTHKEHTV